MNHFKKLMAVTSWDYGSEGATFSVLLATVGMAFNRFIGGYDHMIQLLILLMVVDFVTGFLAAMKEKRVNSDVMFWGGIRKVFVLALVGIGVQLDHVLQNPEPILRTAIIWFYIGREMLSLLENAGIFGMPLPPKLIEILEQMKGRVK